MQKNKTLVNRAMTAMFVAGFAATIFPVHAFAGGNTNTFVQAQQNAVKGTVVDEFGEPMIGVTIKVKNSQAAAITDLDGNFSINAANGATIEISYVGYITQTVKLTNGMKVQLQPDNQMMDEIVVIGYGTIKKRDLTGAVTSVKSEDITLNPGANAMDALQGKVAGLDISRSSGQAGATPTVQLRGNRSFSADGTPTYIIDGMPGDINTINPNDIESIEVLKDASSTAVYGSAGANGIIIVTTKSGKAGKITVNLNAYLGINGWSTVPEVYDAEGFYNLRKLSLQEGGGIVDESSVLGSAYSSFQAAKELNPNLTVTDYLRTHSLNWADELLKTGMTQNYSLSVSGGNEKTKAYMSLNFSDEKGQYANDNNKIYSTNIRVDHQINNWLAAGVNIQGSFNYRNKGQENLYKLLSESPIGSFYDEQGNPNICPIDGSGTVSILVNNKGNYRNNYQGTHLHFNPYIRITPLKGLTLESRVNATLSYGKTNRFEGIGCYNYYENSGADATGTNSNVYASINNSFAYNYTWENILTYNFNINKVHEFTVTGVTSWSHNRTEVNLGYGNNLSSNSYLWHNLDENLSNRNNTYATSNYTMRKKMGYVGRINYSYLGRYLASVSVRHDGDSRLATGNKWDTFPAFSLGWRISDEKFMESTRSWLDNLKIRIGYGVTGTANINPYSSYSTFKPGTLGFSNGSAFITNYTQNIANFDLGWEKSKNWNIGIDAAFLNGRIDATIDYYSTKTEDVIYEKDLGINNGGFSASAPFKTMMNICETQNNGLELAITGRPFIAKKPGGFSWTVNATFTANHEEIKKLATPNDVIGSSTIYRVGEPINSFYEYKLNGTWTLDEAEDAAVFNQKPGHLKIDIPGLIHDGPGQYSKWVEEENANGEIERVLKHYDKDNLYVISDNDKQVLGHKSPDWTAGLKNTFTYKNFDLSIYMYMRWGQMISYDLVGACEPNVGRNFPTNFDFWTTETGHESHYFPAINSTMNRIDYTGYSGLSFTDGSFFKVKNITLGYTLPTNIAKKVGIENLRIYGTITNPIIIAKSDLLENYDPEMGGSMSYPLTKQLVFGVNLTF